MSTRLEILDAPTESGAPRRLPIVDSGSVSPTILLIQNSHRPTLSCQELREALASCVLKTDCVLKSSPPNTVQDCLRDHIDELPMECRHLRTAFFECKRGMLDMRKRFRGLDPGQKDRP